MLLSSCPGFFLTGNQAHDNERGAPPFAAETLIARYYTHSTPFDRRSPRDRTGNKRTTKKKKK